MMEDFLKKPPLQMGRVFTIPSSNGDHHRRHDTDDDDDEDEEPETHSMFTNSKAILLVAISVLCVAVVMPRMFGPPVGGEVRSADKTDHHQQERTHVNPGANIVNPAMTERGRMGAHPGAHSIIGEDQRRLPHLRPGASRMPPLPIRPTMGGPGMQPQQPQGGGTMAIFTFGIIIFLVYTAMKIMLKNTKTDEDEEDEVENDRTYTDKVKWDDMSLRIERIGEIVKGIAEQDVNIQAIEEIHEKPTDDNLMDTEFIQNIDNRLSEDNLKNTEFLQNLEDEESIIKDNEVSAARQEGRCIKFGRIDEAEDTSEEIDPQDVNIIAIEEINEKPTEDNLIDTECIQNIDDNLSEDDEFIQNLEDEESTIEDNEVSTAGQEGRSIKSGRNDEAEDTPEEIDPRDLEISLLKARLEETEKAMERIVAQMGMMTSRLAPHVIAQALEGIDFHKDEEKFKHKNFIKNQDSGIMNAS
eukprot:GFUD01124121.1.p1 GENE.GFUD01124121.1~~GFUD01124121.1.p1  ORF type:complete len:469 (+),score=158.75 GFUD01124121.1:38-1444(+)